MILPSQFLANGTLHKTGQRGQNIDGGIDLSVVQLTVDEDLPFSDIASQIRNRVRNICKT